MAIELTDILKITDTTSLKDFRDKIAELREEISKLKLEGKDYTEQAQEIDVVQKHLNDVMTSSKKYTTDAEGSFNALNAKLRQLKEEWKATGDAAERARLGDEVNKIKSQMNSMNESIGNYQHNVGNYTDSIVKAFEQMGISVTSLTAPLKKIGVDIDSIDTSVKLLQGSFKTFSGQNLAALKSALAGATAGVRTFVVGLSGIQKAILATGIGALIVTLGVLIAKWDDWFGVTENEREALEKTKIAIKELDDEMTDQERLLSYHLEQKKLQGETELQVLQYENEELKKLKELAQAKADEIFQNMLLITSEDELAEARKNHEKAMEKVNSLSARIQQNYLNQSLAIERKRQKEREKSKEQAKKNAEEEKKYIDNLVKKEMEKVDKIIDKERERMESAFELQKELEDARKTDTELENADYYQKKKLLKDFGLSTEELEKEHQKNLSEIRHNAAMQDLEFQEEMRQKQQDLADTQRDTEKVKAGQSEGLNEFDIDAIIERNNAEFEAAKTLNDAKIALNKELMLNYREDSEEYRELLMENDRLSAETAQAQADRDLKNEKAYKKVMKARLEAANQMATGTSTILKNLSSVMGENTKASKGFAIAAATIDTIAAAVSGFRAGYNQWKDAPGPLAAMAPIQGALNAAMALTAGFAEVQKIRSVDPNGNGGGGGGATALAIPNIEGLASPVDYTRQVTTETEREEMNRDNRVYILESDIQDSGRRVRVREEETTF